MKEKRRGSMSTLAALLVLLVFAAGILLVLVSGGRVYRRLNDRSQRAYDSRTCAQYLANKVRQAPDGVSVESFSGEDALVIREEIGGTVYQTWVYCHDGWLMELFAAADGDFSPEDGEKLLPLRELSVERDGALLRFAYETVQGDTGKLTLTVPVSGEVRP